jgi:hypothetical protein
VILKRQENNFKPVLANQDYNDNRAQSDCKMTPESFSMFSSRRIRPSL